MQNWSETFYMQDMKELIKEGIPSVYKNKAFFFSPPIKVIYFKSAGIFQYFRFGEVQFAKETLQE